MKGKRHNPYGRGKATIPFEVRVQPRSVMGDNIALHGLLPKNELPKSLRGKRHGKIPENEIWIRKDVYDNPKRRDRILQGHEKYELTLMETRGLTYKQAHRRAQWHEKIYKLKEKLRFTKKHPEVVTVKKAREQSFWKRRKKKHAKRRPS